MTRTTSTDGWHPRGTPTWPDWKSAKPGTRVEHVRSGYQGALVRAVHGRTQGARYAIIAWDNGARGRVVAPAFDLRPTCPHTSPNDPAAAQAG